MGWSSSSSEARRTWGRGGARGGGLGGVRLQAGIRRVAGWGAEGWRLGCVWLRRRGGRGGRAAYVLDIEDAVAVDVAVELARAHRAAAAAALGLGLQGAPRAAWLRRAVRRAGRHEGTAGAPGAAERDVAAARGDLAQVGAVVLVGAVARVARDQALDLVGGVGLGLGLGLGWGFGLGLRLLWGLGWGLGWGWGLGLGWGWSEEALDLARDARHDRGRSDEIERDGGELHEASGEGALLVAEQQDLVEREVVERRLVRGGIMVRVRIMVRRVRARARVGLGARARARVRASWVPLKALVAPEPPRIPSAALAGER